jgi:hypothetical protein
MDVNPDSFLDAFVQAFAAYAMLEQPEYTCRVSTGPRPNLSDAKKYISPQVFGYIASNDWQQQRFQYTFDGVGVQLAVWVAAPNTGPSLRLNVVVLIKIFNYLLFALNRIRNKHTTNVVDVTIVCCDIPKTFPDSSQTVLNQNHINSGYMERLGLAPDQARKVVVYRAEELVKVLLHELIHLYDIDFHAYPFEFDKYFMSAYKISIKRPWKNSNNPLALYESYTETLASYGNIIAHTLFTDKRVKRHGVQPLPWVEIVDGVRERMVREVKFYGTQVDRVMWFARNGGGYIEDSHVFSYFFVKCALFRRFDDFKDFINDGIAIGTRIDEYLSMVKRVVLLESRMLTDPLKPMRKKPYKETSRMTNIKWPNLVVRTSLPLRPKSKPKPPASTASKRT